MDAMIIRLIIYIFEYIFFISIYFWCILWYGQDLQSKVFHQTEKKELSVEGLLDGISFQSCSIMPISMMRHHASKYYFIYADKQEICLS